MLAAEAEVSESEDDDPEQGHQGSSDLQARDPFPHHQQKEKRHDHRDHINDEGGVGGGREPGPDDP